MESKDPAIPNRQAAADVRPFGAPPLDAPSYDRDFYSDAFILDPYPHYARMRALGPVVWLSQHGNYALTRHAEVQAALRDHDLFISSKGVAGDQFGCDFLQGNTVASDEPKHSELRRAMAPPLLPGSLATVEASVQKTADALIDSLMKRSTFDAVADLARHLPLTIVRDMVGLPEFGQENMLKWAGAAFDVLGMQNKRGRDALAAIGEMREFIQRDATREKLKKGSWTHRIHKLVDEGNLACEHAAFAIRDYINPSLDTTISATGELIYQLARNPDQWEALKQDPTLINNAVNEAVRLGTPIRAFSRHASRDVEIAGTLIPQGARVMMLFASANRDERIFPDPDCFRLDRPSQDHLGFGSGIHMCVGMHLAQLEMEALLRAMIPRIGSFELGQSAIALNNSIRAFSALEIMFTKETRPITVPMAMATPNALPAPLLGRITKRHMTANDIVHLTIEPDDGGVFPAPEPGAHIDIHLSSNVVRQYSLTGPMECEHYEIAVQLEPASRGGSRAVHALKEGMKLRLGQPRNNFRLVESTGKTLLLAGGIGLTPLWSMAWVLHRQKRPFELHIATRSRDRLAFAVDLANAPFASNITIYFDDDPSTRLDVGGLAKKAGTTAHIYACGPLGFMEYVKDALKAANHPSDQLHLEHFGAEIDVDGDPFKVIAQTSGVEFYVSADETILTALQRAGIDVPTSCENGVCGSCLTTVLQGTPDHRDLVQTENQKAANTRIAVCCSRSKSRRLVLDI